MIKEPVLKFVLSLQAIALVVGGALVAFGTLDAQVFYTQVVAAVVATIGAFLARDKVTPV